MRKVVNVLQRINNSYLKLDKSALERLLLFSYFMMISILLIVLKYTFLNDNDDLILWSLLSSGEPKTLIMSYPLSIVLSFLYKVIPNVEWYSLTVFFYMSLISLLFSFYISQLNNTFLKILSTLVVTLILVHVWLQVSVTIVTLLLIAASLPLIRHHQIIFWIMILLASFLRTGIIFSLSPLFVLVYFLLVDKKYFTPKRVLIILTLIGAILLNYISPTFNKEYKEWMQYNKARAYFVDLRGKQTSNILNKEEEFLASLWWAQDRSLLPSKKVVEAAGSASGIALEKLSDFMKSPQLIVSFLSKKEHKYKLLMLLALLTLYLLFIERSIFSKLLYLLFIFGFFVLIIVRDYDRATFPLIILWGVLVTLQLLENKKIILLSIFLLITIPVLWSELKTDRIVAYKANEDLENEFLQIVNSSPMQYEVSTGFPRNWNHYIDEVFDVAHIFDEKHWIHCSGDKVFLSAWISRHPYFYASHDISSKGKQRKYKSFYEFLLDKKTRLIGPRAGNQSINNFILKMYDKKHKLPQGCRHTIKISNETEHFSITQFTIKCKK